MKSIKRDQVIKHFDESYKKGKAPWVWPEVSKDIIKFADNANEEFSGGRLLDLGCGSGWLSAYFAQRGFIVDGVDSSPTAIIEANKLKEEKNLTNLNFFLGDVLEYSFKDGDYDIVFDRGFLSHVSDEEWNKYIEVVSNTLKKDGLLFLSAFSVRSSEDFLTPEEKEQMWRKKEDEKGGLSYDYFFNKETIEKIFSPYFEILDINDNNTDRSASGPHIIYVTMRKK